MSNKVNEATQAEGLIPQEENTELVSTESIANIDELLEKSSGLGELKTVVNLSPTTITLEVYLLVMAQCKLMTTKNLTAKELLIAQSS
jgi:hypothetical protein